MGTGHPAESLVMPKKTTDLAEHQHEDSGEDPNLHLNIEKLNRVYDESEKFYDFLMNRHWPPLGTIHPKISDDIQKRCKMFIKLPNSQINYILFCFCFCKYIFSKERTGFCL